MSFSIRLGETACSRFPGALIAGIGAGCVLFRELVPVALGGGVGSRVLVYGSLLRNAAEKY
jgi:hypothetical protein